MELPKRTASAAAETEANITKVLALQPASGRIHDDHTFYYVAKLTNVPWPGIAHQGIQGIVGDLAGMAAVLGREFLQEVAYQQGHIFLPFAQRRHGKGYDVEAI